MVSLIGYARARQSRQQQLVNFTSITIYVSLAPLSQLSRRRFNNIATGSEARKFQTLFPNNEKEMKLFPEREIIPKRRRKAQKLDEPIFRTPFTSKSSSLKIQITFHRCSRIISFSVIAFRIPFTALAT